MLPDRTGKFAALYRPIHMIGLELGISVASARYAMRRPARRTDFVPMWWRPPNVP